MAALAARRSHGRVRPDPVPRAMIEELLATALRAPNHHLTAPWRFVVLAGPARRALGEAHAAALARASPGLSDAAREKEAGRLERAPVVVVCVAAGASDDPVTRREDRDAVAAGVQNLLLAAQARGLGAMWRTGAMADAPAVHAHLGLPAGAEIVAFVYLGWPRDGAPAPTPRPPLKELARFEGFRADDRPSPGRRPRPRNG
jgi:nitroreductase